MTDEEVNEVVADARTFVYPPNHRFAGQACIDREAKLYKRAPDTIKRILDRNPPAGIEEVVVAYCAITDYAFIATLVWLAGKGIKVTVVFDRVSGTELQDCSIGSVRPLGNPNRDYCLDLAWVCKRNTRGVAAPRLRFAAFAVVSSWKPEPSSTGSQSKDLETDGPAVKTDINCALWMNLLLINFTSTCQTTVEKDRVGSHRRNAERLLKHRVLLIATCFLADLFGETIRVSVPCTNFGRTGSGHRIMYLGVESEIASPQEQLLALDTGVSDAWMVDILVRSMSQFEYYQELHTFTLFGTAEMTTPLDARAMIIILEQNTALEQEQNRPSANITGKKGGREDGVSVGKKRLTHYLPADQGQQAQTKQKVISEKAVQRQKDMSEGGCPLL
ncbi:hypothetical protein ON010_g11017 [Phytophthora cinnamomi]|nr:hypothetical protein ON010_g11017 [Phytophthora cinnamomi]